MKKTDYKKCENCGKNERSEPLYTYRGEVLCPFCVAALMVETTVGVDTYTEEEENEKNKD